MPGPGLELDRRPRGTPGCSALTALATPPISPPPPTGTTTHVDVRAPPRRSRARPCRRRRARPDRRTDGRTSRRSRASSSRSRSNSVARSSWSDDLGAVAAHRVDLGARRVGRHHHRARHADHARRPRHRLRVVAGRDRDEPARAPLGRRATARLVERAARLERAGLLEALALEVEPHAGALARGVREESTGVRWRCGAVRAAASRMASIGIRMVRRSWQAVATVSRRSPGPRMRPGGE